jgi:prepilin-type N-terminal cleavage/methylation domain-containing protein
MLFRSYPSRAFTLIEVLTTIAILAAITTAGLFFVGSYIETSRRAADRQNLTVLNDAITRYKVQGGGVNGLSEAMGRNNLLSRLQTEVSWNGLHHQFLRSGFTIPSGVTLEAKGDRQQYRITRYGTYSEESGGTTLPAYSPVDPTGLIVWHDFDSAIASYGSTNLSVANGATFVSGYGVCLISGNQRFGMAQGSGWPSGASGTCSLVVRLRLHGSPPATNQAVLTRVGRDNIVWRSNGTLACGISTWDTSGITFTPAVDMWYTIALTKDSPTQTVKLYVNGSYVGSQTAGATNSSGGWYIGGNSGGTVSSDVDFSHLSLWNRELTAEEVARISNGGSEFTYSDL